jgi:hypothetical protein
MDDDGDLHEQILHIEAHIEDLTDIIERCRKIILISKVAIAAGGILILATIIGAVGADPTVLIGAIAAVIGGTVVFGSNTSTLKHTMADMKAAEAHRRVNQQNGLRWWEMGRSRTEQGGIGDAHSKARLSIAGATWAAKDRIGIARRYEACSYRQTIRADDRSGRRE